MQCLRRRPSAGRRLFSTAPLPTPGTLPTSSAASASLPSVDASVLTDADISRFNQESGTAALSPGVTGSNAMREGAEANLSDPGPSLCGPLCDEHAAAAGTGGRFHDDQFLWHRHAIFADFVLRAGAGAIAARAMGSRTAQSEARPVVGERPSRHGCCSPVDRQNALEAHILYDQLFVKEPGTAAPTPRHNDTSYRHKTRPRPVCSVWLALDEVPRERGSHTWGLTHRITNFSGSDEVDSRNVYHGAEGYPPVPDIDAGVASGQYELLGWDMAPGDAWLRDALAGFDCGLAAGEHIGCSLHPDVLHPSGNLE
ncbi:hypothetical protein EMIHUDRAFT_114003 [Emiliania huxleyi CCMP1516]|uniref:Uncharacterized protein n=2 Tax=Emiliania huxleyi TaxID=2903 RepID=A0A0D3JZJ0_EMIH1|nr:hypothetical protein EMIHUDRAFT_114003 [Emiliania huxleyi CCMP1516]EOD28925.1 hypothetical protein EMIHUDRAFT_114003 [Emiliania huxleyi CCMP1516]|eukprot:XP_005781354.1 hypothetical protein EMIHUDRAFT_114003 [Emiliania huxleyi CCMP1516]